MGPAEWALMFVLSLLWGGSFIFNKIALQSIPPISVVAGRLAIGAVILHGVRLLRRQPFPLRPSVLGAFLVMGIVNNAVPFLLIACGQTRIAAGLASILNATTPVFTVVVAHLFTRDERLTGLRLLGVIVGFTGVVLIIGPTALHGLLEDLWGQLAVVGAALSYSFAGVYARRFSHLGIPPLVTATGQVSASALILVALFLILNPPWASPVPPRDALLAVVAMGLLSTAAAYMIYFRILASAGATNVLLVTFLLPVVAIALGALIFGEQIDVLHLVGMVVIAVGFALIDGRLFQRSSG